MGSQIDPRLHVGQLPLPHPGPPPSLVQQHHPPQQLPPPHQPYPPQGARLPRIQPNSDQPSLSTESQLQQPYYRPAPYQPREPVHPAPSARYYTSHPTYSDPHLDQQYERGPSSPTDDPNGDPSDPKRSRACEACRGLKVRCDQNPENPSGPCKRCSKAKRQCIVTAPSRKRQKKTDSRVAELEKKIDALTATLNAQNKDVTSPHSSTRLQSVSSPDSTYSASGPHAPYTSQDGHRWSQHEDATRRMHSISSPGSRSVGSETAAAKRRRSVDGAEANPEKHSRHEDGAAGVESEYSDDWTSPVAGLNDKVDIIMSRRMAEQVFERYVLEMAQHMPSVVFPLGTTADEVRHFKPIVFLSVLVAAAVGLTPVQQQEELSQLLMGAFADCVIRNGEKSLDLIQALTIAAIWYRPPKRYEQMNFYQLSHIAAVMAIDVGMGKRMPISKAMRKQAAGGPPRQMPKHMVDSDTVEARRTWLGCYFICANTSMTLRRPNLIRWGNYMDECIEVLESSTTGLPSDRVLCQHVKLQHINEEVGLQFSMDDPSASITILDSRVQHALKSFEKTLKDWSKAVPASLWTSTLHYSQYVSSLYMHEVAMHINHNVDDFRAPFTEESLKAASGQSNVLSPAHSAALSECLSSVHGIFNLFFNFDEVTLRALPIFYFVRVAYAVVVLIKLYFAVTAPGSEVGKMFSKEDLRVEHYLDTLLEIFRRIDKENAFRPAQKFLMILSKMQEWFHKNKDSGDVPRDASRFNPWAAVAAADEATKERERPRPAASATLTQQAQAQAQQGQRTQYDQSTPLHFLSDVATHSNPGAHGATTSSTPGPVGMAQAEQPQGQMQSNGQAAWYGGQMGINVGMMGTMDMSGQDGGADFGMGSGFEQAMDMTLGTADENLSSLFMGDPMFNFGGGGFGGGNGTYYTAW